MNSETLSDKRANAGFLDGIFNVQLFFDTLKRNKIQIIIAGIAMFMASPFVLIMTRVTTGSVPQTPVYSSFMPLSFYHYADMNALPVVLGFMTVVSVILGVCFALGVTGYKHDRKAAVFYGSIPVTKRALFTTQTLCGIVYFMLPLLLVYLISLAIMPGAVTIISLTKIFVICKFIYLLVYSFTIFAANLAGTAFSTVLSAVFMAFGISWIFQTLTVYIGAFYRFTNIEAFNELTGKLATLPVVYFIGEVTSKWRLDFNFVLICLPIMLVLSAGFLALGGLLDHASKTENAEKPFYFRFAQIKFKYILLSIIIILTGVGFYQGFGNSLFYMITGVITGGFIAFLALNFLIQRSIREIFTGIKQFGIFILTASVAMTVFTFDIFGIDRYIPEASKVESVTLISRGMHRSVFRYDVSVSQPQDGLIYMTHFGSNNFKITDPEAIELVNAVLEAAMKSSPNGKHSYYGQPVVSGWDGDYDYYVHYERVMLRDLYVPFFIDVSNVTYSLKNGSAVHKTIPRGLRFNTERELEDYDRALTAFNESPGFREAYFYPFTEPGFMENMIKGQRSLISLNVTESQTGAYFHVPVVSGEVLLELINRFVAEIGGADFGFGSLGVYTADFTLFSQNDAGNMETHSFSVNINESFTDTIRFIGEIIATHEVLTEVW
jgi:hypothetical protein